MNVQTNKVSSSLGTEEQIGIATNITQQLIQLLTEPQNKPLLPNDLGASARILTAVINILENNSAISEVLLFNHPLFIKTSLNQTCIVHYFIIIGCD